MPNDQKPVAASHVIVTKFVYKDGSIKYRVMPQDKESTPEDVIESVLNGLILLVPLVEQYTGDRKGVTYSLVRRILKDILVDKCAYAAVWPRVEVPPMHPGATMMVDPNYQEKKADV